MWDGWEVGRTITRDYIPEGERNGRDIFFKLTHAYTPFSESLVLGYHPLGTLRHVSLSVSLDGNE